MLGLFVVVIATSILSIIITEVVKSLARAARVKRYNRNVRKYRDKAYDELLMQCKERAGNGHSDLISIDEIGEAVETKQRIQRVQNCVARTHSSSC